MLGPYTWREELPIERSAECCTKSFRKSGLRATSKVLVVVPAQPNGNQNRLHASLKSSRGPRGMSFAGSP